MLRSNLFLTQSRGRVSARGEPGLLPALTFGHVETHWGSAPTPTVADPVVKPTAEATYSPRKGFRGALVGRLFKRQPV